MRQWSAGTLGAHKPVLILDVVKTQTFICATLSTSSFIQISLCTLQWSGDPIELHRLNERCGEGTCFSCPEEGHSSNSYYAEIFATPFNICLW